MHLTYQLPRGVSWASRTYRPYISQRNMSSKACLSLENRNLDLLQGCSALFDDIQDPLPAFHEAAAE